jgi:hypothetical protein
VSNTFSPIGEKVYLSKAMAKGVNKAVAEFPVCPGKCCWCYDCAMLVSRTDNLDSEYTEEEYRLYALRHAKEATDKYLASCISISLINPPDISIDYIGSSSSNSSSVSSSFTPIDGSSSSSFTPIDGLSNTSSSSSSSFTPIDGLSNTSSSSSSSFTPIDGLSNTSSSSSSSFTPIDGLSNTSSSSSSSFTPIDGLSSSFTPIDGPSPDYFPPPAYPLDEKETPTLSEEIDSQSMENSKYFSMTGVGFVKGENSIIVDIKSSDGNFICKIPLLESRRYDE